MSELNKLGKEINSINISNINTNKLVRLEEIVKKLNPQNSALTNTNKAIYSGTYEEIRKKFLDLSYLIYLKSYNSQTAEEFKNLFDLQKKLLEIYKKYFNNPQKIEDYLNYMKVILFLIFPEQKILSKKELNIDNSFNIFGFTGQNNKGGGLDYFLYILNTELLNLQKKENNLKILKLKSNALNRLCEIFFEFKLNIIISINAHTNKNYKKVFKNNLEEKKYKSLELIKECYIIFLQNIFDIAVKFTDTELLSYLEIYNNTYAVYGKYFGYPNKNRTSNDSIIAENFEKLFEILKKSNKINKKEVKSIINSILNKVQNIQKTKGEVKLQANLSTNNLKSKNLYELKKLAEDTLQLLKNSKNQYKNTEELLFEKLIQEINRKLLQFSKNIEQMKKQKPTWF